MEPPADSLNVNLFPNDALPAGTMLNGYKITSVLGRGSFGITYLATEEHLDRPVAIKEYLPQEFATRDESSTVRAKSDSQSNVFRYGKDSFLKEARTQVKFRHPNIVRVLTFFELNETAYIVMENEEGVSLYDYFKQHPRLSQTKLLAIFKPIIEGLATVHEYGFIHRDIKPKNILIRADKSPVLLDFGAARNVVTNKTDELTRILTHGYAPYEQENPAWAGQGPWTDIYALGATLYMGVMGKKPESGSRRAAAHMMKKQDPYIPAATCSDKKYSQAFLVAIDKALEFVPEKRPQTLKKWLQMLFPKQQERKFVPPKDLVTENRSNPGHTREPVAATEARPELFTDEQAEKTRLIYPVTGLITVVAVVLLTMGAGVYLFKSPESTAETPAADNMDSEQSVPQQSIISPGVLEQNDAAETPSESPPAQTATNTIIKNKTAAEIILAADSGIQLEGDHFIISNILEQTLKNHTDNVQRQSDGSLIIYLDHQKLYPVDGADEFTPEGLNLLNRLDYVFRNNQNFLILITDRTTSSYPPSKAILIKDFLVSQGLPRSRIQTAGDSAQNANGFSGIKILLIPKLPVNS